MFEIISLLAVLLNAQVLPNPKFTTGKIDPTKTTAILCAKGYTTKSVRPPNSYTNGLKIRQIMQYSLKGNPGDYEEDHLISLELGGDPLSPLNLWPQPWKPEPGAKAKDKLENVLHKMVCAGKIPLAQAQKEIAEDWWLAYQKYVASGEHDKHKH